MYSNNNNNNNNDIAIICCCAALISIANKGINSIKKHYIQFRAFNKRNLLRKLMKEDRVTNWNNVKIINQVALRFKVIENFAAL